MNPTDPGALLLREMGLGFCVSPDLQLAPRPPASREVIVSSTQYLRDWWDKRNRDFDAMCNRMVEAQRVDPSDA